MSAKAFAKNVTLEVHRFERGSQGAVVHLHDVHGVTVYQSSTVAPRDRFGCDSARVERFTYLWVRYAGVKYVVEKPTRNWVQRQWNHGWKIALGSTAALTQRGAQARTKRAT